MKLDEFDYDLPANLIAQSAVEPRDASRLLVLRRATGEIHHTRFSGIRAYLRPGDLLVLNETRVIPARLFARKAPSGGRVEVLLLNQKSALDWEALVGGKRVRAGTVLEIEKGEGLKAEVLQELTGARRLLRFSGPLAPVLAAVGHVPLPPYIHEPLTDPERYQTVYARRPGSAAAPTAGLHFTPELLEHLRADGVRLVFLTLHVGLDTFAPVAEPEVEKHPMHGEWFAIPPKTAEAIASARREGRRVIAVGTTSVRALESAAPEDGSPDLAIREGMTQLFIRPGYRFRAVDAFLTNFHLPRTTLLMLVSAFAGRDLVLAAYHQAMALNYRFYSFGDAMLIL
jgi:S-adenosylmethionine:tRNA ribosyltransferase-isomerase